MKTKLCACTIVLTWLAGVHQTPGQAVVINSFSQNGVLVCSGLQTGTVANVEWASSVSGPWQTNWSGLTGVAVGQNGTISVSVPMFYRVLGVAAPPGPPAGMTLIPAGSFTMGDTLDGEFDAMPTNVYISAFYMDTNMVTYSQWQPVYAWAVNHGYDFDDVGSGTAADHPVQTVNWYDAVKWSNARSQQAGLTPVYYTDAGLTQVYTNGDVDLSSAKVNWAANGYRLPTEAEWEKAARGGLSGQRFPWGNTLSQTQANYFGCISTCGFGYDLGPNGYSTNFDTGGSQAYTSPAGYFPPNGYGLHDMAGNMSAWCWDWYWTPYGQPTTNNPTGPPGPRTYHLLRGGNWSFYASNARCAARFNSNPHDAVNYIGFRCVSRF